MLLVRRPFGVLRGYQRLDPFRQQGLGILGIEIKTGFSIPEVFFVLEGLCCGAIGYLVALELIDALHGLQHYHDHP